MNAHQAAYLILGIQIIIVELWGVFSTKKYDTISEHYWWLRDRSPSPWLINGAMVLFLVWLGLHFAFGNRGG